MMKGLVPAMPQSRPGTRALVFGIFGFALAVAGCWVTEVLDPPFSLMQVTIDTIVISFLGFFTLRSTLRFIHQLETTSVELKQRYRELQEQAAQLEASRTRLLELDELKSDFLSLVSHELRTPLTSIIGFSRTLMTLPLGVEQHQRYLGIIESEGKRLAALVDEYLDISQIESGRFELRCAPVDMARLVQEVVEQIETGSGARIGTALSGELPVVTGDAGRLRRVLLNLTENALRYTRKGTTPVVSAAAADGGVCVSVQDHGPGLTAEESARVFEKFYRGRDGITTRSRGSGLGLTIARRIVEAHGGRLWVESEPGHGATFRFWIPKERMLEGRPKTSAA
jgi:signal transduction histidine kinase